MQISAADSPTTYFSGCGPYIPDLHQSAYVAALDVVVASDGYPSSYETGCPITIDDGLEGEVFFAGAKMKDGVLVTGGGRVLGVTARAETLQLAIQKSYRCVEKVHFSNAYYRKDIGNRALAALENE